MKTWARAQRGGHFCGNCGAGIAVGAPFLTLQIGTSTWTTMRCAPCAKAPVPADVPDEVVPIVTGPTPTLKRSRAMSSTRELAEDVKALGLPKGDR